jgi:hypothetical protein
MPEILSWVPAADDSCDAGHENRHVLTVRGNDLVAELTGTPAASVAQRAAANAELFR